MERTRLRHEQSAINYASLREKLFYRRIAENISMKVLFVKAQIKIVIFLFKFPLYCEDRTTGLHTWRLFSSNWPSQEDFEASKKWLAITSLYRVFLHNLASFLVVSILQVLCLAFEIWQDWSLTCCFPFHKRTNDWLKLGNWGFVLWTRK